MADIYAIHKSSNGKDIMVIKNHQGKRELLKDNVPEKNALLVAIENCRKGERIYIDG